MKYIKLIVACSVLFAGCTAHETSDTTSTEFSLNKPAIQTISCTKDKVHGTFAESCYGCSVQPRDCVSGDCDRLECTCKRSGGANGTAIYLRECDQCQFWNDHGNLRCGNG